MAVPNPNPAQDEVVEQDIHQEDDMLDETEADEEIEDDGDVPMDSDDEGDEGADREMQMEIQLQNDSIAHFDAHTDSIFCIAQHPVHSHIVATGGGDDAGYVFDVSSSQQSESAQGQERDSLRV